MGCKGFLHLLFDERLDVSDADNERSSDADRSVIRRH